MRTKTLIATSAATTALLLTPAWALAAGGAPSHPGADHPNAQNNPGVQHRPAGTPSPGPNASAKAKRNAYGVYCAKESRKHVAGQHGTPFSQCVSGAAKLLKDQAATGDDNTGDDDSSSTGDDATDTA